MNAYRGRLTLAAITSALVLMPHPSVADKVKLKDLGTLDRAFSSATAILPDGSILGQVANTADSKEKAFLYVGGQRVELSLGGSVSFANFDAASGRVFGRSAISGDGETHAFFVDGLAAVDIGTLGGSLSEIFGISKNGRYFVGSSLLPGGLVSHAFRYDAQTRNIEDLGGAGGASARGLEVTDDGRVVGDALTADERTVGFLYDSAGMHVLSLGGSISTASFSRSGDYAFGSGNIIGADQRFHAFAYGPNGLRELTFGGDFGWISPIDKYSGTNGNLIGYEFQAPDNYRAFVYNAATDVSQELMPPGAVATLAFWQTLDGRVMGRFRDANGIWQAYVYDLATGEYRTPGLGGESWINGWNRSGQFVGGSFAAGAPTYRAYVYDWNTGVTKQFDTLGGFNNDAQEISDDGRIIGVSNTSGYDGSVAFLIDSAGTHPLSLGGESSSAEFINDGALVVGSSALAGGGEHVFEYDAGGLHEISLGGAQSVIRFYNRSGRFVGTATTASGASHGFYYDSSTNVTLDFGTLGGPNSLPVGINEDSIMAGNSQIGPGSNFHAFLATVGPGDDTAPSTDFDIVSPANGAGWHNHDVTVRLFAEDEPGGSGLKEITYSASGAQSISATTVNASPAEFLISSEGETSITFTATDNEGNRSEPKFIIIRLDKTAPVIVAGPFATDWSAHDLTVSFTGTDTLSGLVDPSDANFALSTSVSEGTETGAASTDSRMITDLAGNAILAGPISGLKVDKKAPVIAVNIANGAQFLLNQGVSAAFTATDNGSGVDSVTGSTSNGGMLNTGSVGNKTLTVTARDNVGNESAPVTITYTVSYGIRLLYDAGRAVRSGAAYPIKLQLVDAAGNNVSAPGISLHAVTVRKKSDNTSDAVDEAGSSNEDADFRYDSGLAGYIFNLKTRGLGTGTYDLVFTAGDDPAEHFAQFVVR